MAKKKKVPWESMLTEQGIRARIARESPATVQLLDYLATCITPYEDGQGWTVFNDWIDACYHKKHVDRRPDGIPWLSLNSVRETVFPACKTP